MVRLRDRASRHEVLLRRDHPALASRSQARSHLPRSSGHARPGGRPAGPHPRDRSQRPLPGAVLVVSTLDTTDSAIEARRLEAEWIERLNTHCPAGYNLMPGGSSLGGPSNAKSVTVAIPGRGVRTFSTIQDAIADRMRTTLPVIQPSTVYARLAMGWSAAEALGYRKHEDGRRLRPAFRFATRFIGTSARPPSPPGFARTRCDRGCIGPRWSTQAASWIAALTVDAPGAGGRACLAWSGRERANR